MASKKLDELAAALEDYIAKANAQAAEQETLINQLSAKVDTLERRILEREGEEAAKPFFEDMSLLDFSQATDPATVPSSDKSAPKLNAGQPLKLNESDGVPMEPLFQLTLTVKEWAERKDKRVPFNWQLDALDVNLMRRLLMSIDAVGLPKPHDGPTWFKFLIKYIEALGSPLSELLAKVDHLAIGNSISLPVLLKEFGRVKQALIEAGGAASAESKRRLDARRLVVSAMAVRLPILVRQRMYSLGQSPSDDPKVSLTMDDLFATVTKAITQVWEESSETATQSEAFPPRDKHGKSPKAAVDDKPNDTTHD